MDREINRLVLHMHGGFNVPLRERTCSQERPYGCHEHGTYAEVAEMAVDLEQEFAANARASRYGAMECRPCYQMHRESPLTTWCYACHHGCTFERCGTCHATAAGGTDD